MKIFWFEELQYVAKAKRLKMLEMFLTLQLSAVWINATALPGAAG